MPEKGKSPERAGVDFRVVLACGVLAASLAVIAGEGIGASVATSVLNNIAPNRQLPPETVALAFPAERPRRRFLPSFERSDRGNGPRPFSEHPKVSWATYRPIRQPIRFVDKPKTSDNLA